MSISIYVTDNVGHGVHVGSKSYVCGYWHGPLASSEDVEEAIRENEEALDDWREHVMKMCAYSPKNLGEVHEISRDVEGYLEEYKVCSEALSRLYFISALLSEGYKVSEG